ncbi:hypothetical protein FKP32DRAFT_1586978 [Trametes sanguinea]|nr:hypothetical protein FKP32DRAFT_1586978 [Trametes sanguinea]
MVLSELHSAAYCVSDITTLDETSTPNLPQIHITSPHTIFINHHAVQFFLERYPFQPTRERSADAQYLIQPSFATYHLTRRHPCHRSHIRACFLLTVVGRTHSGLHRERRDGLSPITPQPTGPSRSCTRAAAAASPTALDGERPAPSPPATFYAPAHSTHPLPSPPRARREPPSSISSGAYMFAGVRLERPIGCQAPGFPPRRRSPIVVGWRLRVPRSRCGCCDSRASPWIWAVGRREDVKGGRG